jgi:hypothetical protein
MLSSESDRWLSQSNESRYNLGILARAPQDNSAFSCFLAVARRSQPLIPAVFDGPVEGLESRVAAFWDAHANKDAFLHYEKRHLACAIANHIAHLRISQKASEYEYLRHVNGHQFFQRRSQPKPFESPLSDAKATMRPKLNEALWFLTVLFHSVDIFPPPAPAPEGKVPYIPYYATDIDFAAKPKQSHASSLARAAMLFRQYAGLPDHRQVFTLFGFARASITPPTMEEAEPLTKQYYAQSARVV